MPESSSSTCHVLFNLEGFLAKCLSAKKLSLMYNTHALFEWVHLAGPVLGNMWVFIQGEYV